MHSCIPTLHDFTKRQENSSFYFNVRKRFVTQLDDLEAQVWDFPIFDIHGPIGEPEKTHRSPNFIKIDKWDLAADPPNLFMYDRRIAQPSYLIYHGVQTDPKQ